MDRLDRPRRHLAIALAVLAGYVDATGYLSASGHFLSFMSGNTTRLGVSAAGDSAQVAIPLALLVGFVAGVTLGALVAERWAARRKTRVLGLVTGLLIMAAAVAPFSRTAALSATVLAMGAVNNVFRRDGEVAIGVTYMTGALVRFGQGIAARILGQPAGGRLSAGMLWLGLAFGAVAGAAAFAAIQQFALWIAAGAAGALLVAVWHIESRGDRPTPERETRT